MTASESTLRVLYHGLSMWPTLRDRDVLLVEAFRDSAIARGDVIVFRCGEDSTLIAHRVESVAPNGLRTRGDYNALSDAYVVNPSDVVGRVTFAERNGRARAIRGGRSGIIEGSIARLRRRIITAILWMPRKLYRLPAASHAVRRLTPGWFRPRLVSFTRPDGTELQLFLGSRPIGFLLPGQKEWAIRAPFRLFVNEQSLPPHPFPAKYP